MENESVLENFELGNYLDESDCLNSLSQSRSKKGTLKTNESSLLSSLNFSVKNLMSEKSWGK